MPPAAAVAVRHGSSAREKVFRSSMAAAPCCIQAPASVKATAATARQPARFTYCCAACVPKVPAREQSAAMATSFTAEAAAEPKCSPSLSSAESHRRENMPSVSSASSTPAPPSTSEAESGIASSTSPAP